MNLDICGNCKFFNENKQMVNKAYLCNFHGYTTVPSNRGCYKIQNNKKSNNI
jgi:hypothetical protein